jgi:hypothetical protein
MKSEVYKRKVDTRDELLARILDAAARIKKRVDQLRRTTRDLRTRVRKCTEGDGGIFEQLLGTVTDLSFLCNICHLNTELQLKQLTVSKLSFFITIYSTFVFVDPSTSISKNIHN